MIFSAISVRITPAATRLLVRSRSSRAPVYIIHQTLNHGFETRNDRVFSSNAAAEKNSADPVKTNRGQLFKRFKEDFSRYWYVMLPIHITTSFGYFLIFFYLSKMGVSPISLMELLSVPENYIRPLRDSDVSHYAVGYAGYKIITPLRYLTTIGTTGIVIRSLSSKGMLPAIPSFGDFKQKLTKKFRN